MHRSVIEWHTFLAFYISTKEEIVWIVGFYLANQSNIKVFKNSDWVENSWHSKKHFVFGDVNNKHVIYLSAEIRALDGLAAEFMC